MATDFYPGLRLDIAADDWEPSGDDEDPTSRLHLRPMLHLAGVPMHFEAHAVTDPPPCTPSGSCSHIQEADHPWGEEVLDAIYGIGGGDKPLTTVEITIDGRTREYVLIAYPHCV